MDARTGTKLAGLSRLLPNPVTAPAAGALFDVHYQTANQRIELGGSLRFTAFGSGLGANPSVDTFNFSFGARYYLFDADVSPYIGGGASWMLLGVNTKGPIEAFLPVIVFPIIFGLSMDYEIFLLSRIHEEWLRTGDNRTAVAYAQGQTGRVITAAAAIMICVFFAFALGGQHLIAEFGVGLVAAVLIDAFVVRSVLVPALMHLLGRANWWLPSGLDRLLPRLAIEAADVSAATAAPSREDDLVGAIED